MRMNQRRFQVFTRPPGREGGEGAWAQQGGGGGRLRGRGRGRETEPAQGRWGCQGLGQSDAWEDRQAGTGQESGPGESVHPPAWGSTLSKPVCGPGSGPPVPLLWAPRPGQSPPFVSCWAAWMGPAMYLPPGADSEKVGRTRRGGGRAEEWSAPKSRGWGQGGMRSGWDRESRKQQRETRREGGRERKGRKPVTSTRGGNGQTLSLRAGPGC